MTENFKDYILNSDDWMCLTNLIHALEPFYDITIHTEEHHGGLRNYFPALDFCLNSCNDTRDEFAIYFQDNPTPENEFLMLGANAAWEKANKFYETFDTSPIYYAAQVLNPRKKWAWMTQSWSEHPTKASWLPQVKRMVNDLWVKEYKGKGIQAGSETASPSPTPPTEGFIGFNKSKRLKKSHLTGDAYARYCDEPI